MIRKIVQQVFKTGYLTTETEEQLRLLFEQGCHLEDIDALTDLQQAVMYGHIKREMAPESKKKYMMERCAHAC